ncbi:MAG: ribosomal L7Ae/L30e/S12e/Gadd45 family protein [Candidatus Micrarchaeota archaeon]|nr:ribosomal L7Ae/L30e/S12e/Gadd45 family protein [Candidatus Micrarchaeota archaeon]
MAIDYAKEIRTLINTGKYVLGTNKVFKEASNGRLKAIVCATNADVLVLKKLEHISKMSDVILIKPPFTSSELGAVCGRAHVVSVIGVYDFGDSKLVSPKN